MIKPLTLITCLLFTQFGYTQTYTPFAKDIDVDVIISTLVDEFLVSNQAKDSIKLSLTPVKWTNILGDDSKQELDFSKINLTAYSNTQIDSLLGICICNYDRLLKDSISSIDKRHLVKQVYPRNTELLRWKNSRKVKSIDRSFCLKCIGFSIPYFTNKNTAIIGVYKNYGWRYDRVGWIMMEKHNQKWKIVQSTLCWMS